MQGHARSLGAVGLGMSAAITAPLVGMATQALSFAADFEKSMNVIEAVTGAPAAAMQALNDQALQLGKDTIFNANEAAEGMLELAKAGMTTEQVAAAIPGVMNLAAAGEMALADAANVATGALQTFNLDASETTRIADLYAAAATASTASVADLTQGQRQAGFAFAAANMPIDDMVTSLALLTNEGLTGSDAGTALKNMLVQLMGPTVKAKKEMKRLGIEIFDVNGNMLMMPDIITEFNEALAGLTMQERNAALDMILGSDGMKAMIPLLDAGTAGFADMKTAVNEQGAAAKIAQALTDGLGGAMERLGGSVSTLLTTTAKPFLGFISDFLDGVGNLIDSIGELPQPVINAALAFGAVLAAAGPLVGIAAAVAFALSALGTAAAPILLVVGAVAALAAGIVYLDSIGVIDLGAMWETAKTKIDAAITSVKAWITQIQTQGLISQETMIASFELPGNWGDILRFTIGMGAALKTLSGAVTGDMGAAEIAELNTVLTQAFGVEIATRIGNIATHIATLKTALADASSVGEWFTGIGTFATNVGTEIQGIVDEARKQIQTALEAIDFTAEFGPVKLSVEPELKTTLEITDIIKGKFDLKNFVGDMKIGETAELKVSPTVTSFKIGEGVEFLVTPTVTSFRMGEGVEFLVTPTITSFRWGEGVEFLVTPTITSFKWGEGVILEVTPEFTKVNIGESFGLQISAGGKIDIKLGASDFNVDFSTLVSTIQIKLATLSGEISSAFNTGGWTGLGALAKEKIAGVGTDIGAAFGEMVLFAQIGLVLAMANLRAQFDTLMAGDTLTMIDASKVGAWAQRQADAAKAQLDAVFGEDNFGTRMIERAQATVTKITDAMAGFGDMSAMERFNAGVASVLATFGLISGFKTEALTAVSTTLTTLATSIAGFATTIIAGLDANMLATTLKGAAKGMSEAIVIAFAPENLGQLGKAAGTMVTTLVTKIGDLLAAPEFGENVGKAVGEAAAAIAVGAAAMVQGIADELGKPGVWDAAVTQIGTFVSGFATGVAEGVKSRDWSVVAQAIVDGIGAAIVAPIKAIINNPAGLLGIEPDAWFKENFPGGEGGFGRRGPVPGGLEVEKAVVQEAVMPPGRSTMQIATGLLEGLEASGIMAPVPVPVDPQWTTIQTAIPDFTGPPVKIPVTAEWPANVADILRPPVPIEIPAKIVPDKTIDIVIPPFEMPVTPKIEWPTGGQLSDILRESMGGGGADTPMSVRVEATSITAAAGLSDLQVTAMVSELKPPAVMPEIKVKGVMSNDVSQASAGLGSVLSQGASEVASSLSGFKWPALPPFEWPKLPPFSWPPYDPFKWPPIPRPDWIDQMRVPRPSWLGEMLSWSPQVQVVSGGAPTEPGQLQHGTSYWRGGWAKVGEEGEEYVNLPRGSKVFDHDTSMAMAGAGGGNVTVQFTGPITIANDMDLNALADKLTYLITQRQNRRG